MSEDKPETDVLDDRPPLLGSWRNIYTVVLLQLAALVGLFAFVTWWAS